MNTTQKLIQPKLGVLKLAEKLGNVSEACRSDGLLKRQLLPLSEAL